MRKLLLALLFVCSSAFADTAAYLQNQAGGQIVLTDTLCSGAGTTYMAYSSIPGRQTIWGCWFSDQVNVHIRWNDGDFRSYSLDANWKYFPNVLRNMRRGGGI